MTGSMSDAEGGLPRPIGIVQDEIIAEMAGLKNRLAKYEYLVRLGRDLQIPDGGIRRDEYALAGCQSRVWIRTELQAGRLHIIADSDATVIRGMIGLLLRVLDGRTPAEILEADLYFLERTGLSMRLSPARSDGLAALVRRIRACAEEAASEHS